MAIADAPLRERESELAVVDEVLVRTGREGSCLVLIEGPAGIGKSRLLDELVVRAAPARARAAGTRTNRLVAELVRRAAPARVRVLAARGAGGERELPAGVVRQLFEPVLG